MQPQVEAWAHRVCTFGKISKRHPQLSYAGLGVSLELEWYYLQRTIPRVGTLMVPIKEAIRQTFFTAIFEGEEVNNNFRKILGHSVKHDGLVTTDSWLSEEIAHSTSKSAFG